MDKIAQTIILVGYVLWAIAFVLWTINIKRRDWEKGTFYSLLMVIINSICLVVYFIGKGI